MSDNRTDLPSPSAPNFNQRLRETIQTYLGRQGNPLDRGLTLRDLIDAGVLKVKSGFTLKPGSVSGSIPVEPGPGVVDVYEPDLTPPPTPTGFTVTAAISNLIIEHDAPIYTQGHGHLRTRLYGKIVNTGDPLPTFADAAEIAQFSGAVYAHPSNPATTWRLWIKWETVDGVLSATPAGGTNGLAVTTGQDVSSLLTALTGEITESQLYQALQSRINLVDGPDTLSGSVAARIKTLSSTVNSNTAAIQLEATTRVNADDSLFAQYTVKIDTNGFVSGFGLASQTVNGVPVSDFQIRADRFSITNPGTTLVTVSSLTRSGTTATATTSAAHNLVVGDTFTLRGVTNDTNWNGAYTVLTRPSTTQITFTVANNLTTPATGTMKVGKTAIPFIVDGGVVYMASAMIKDATITAAKIADLAVDDAKIANLSASKITAGSIAVGQHIQSAGYTAGSSGWRINGDGNAEFGAASIRGQLAASQINTEGLTIKHNGQVILGAGSSLPAQFVTPDGGWLNSNLVPSINAKLSKAGDTISGRINFAVADGMFAGSDTNNGVYFGNQGLVGRKWGNTTFAIGTDGTATFGGALNAATGTFSGALNAATGTFSGSLTASAVNAVNTINIAEQAVTIPVSAYTSGNITIPGSTETTVQSVSLVSTGAPIFLLFTANIRNGDVPVEAGDSDYYSPVPTEIRIYRGATRIQTTSFSESGAMAVTIKDTAGAGSVTYYAKAYSIGGTQVDGSSDAVVSARSLFLLETKR